MRSEYKQSRRAAGAMISAAIGAIGLARAAGATPASWLNPADGTWNVAANWSTPNFPNNGSPTAGDTYDATIGATGASYTVTLNSDVTVDSLTLNAASLTLNQIDGTFRAINGLTLSAGTYSLSSGTISSTTVGGPGTLIVNNQTGNSHLSGDTLASNLTIVSGAVRVDSGLTLNDSTVSIADSLYFGGTETFGGSGTFTFDGAGFADITPPGFGVLTVGPNITVRTGANSGTISLGNSATTVGENDGSLIAQTAGKTLFVTGSDWVNHGSMIVQSGASLSLGGQIAVGGLGTLVNNGGAIYLNNTASLSNAGNTLNITTPINLFGGIGGGTLTTSGAGALIIGNNAVLDGIAIDTDLSVSGVQLNTHGLSLSHTITITNFGELAVFNGLVQGSGTIAFGTGAGYFAAQTGTLTIGSGITVQTAGGGGTVSFGNFNSVAGINNGTISAQTPGTRLVVAGDLWTNNGTLAASNDATLSLQGGIANFGTFIANGGTVEIANSGSLNNSGSTLMLSGPLHLNSGGIGGGTVSTTGSGALIISPGLSGTLDGVTLNTNLSLDGSGLRIFDGLTLNNSTISISNGGSLFYGAIQTIGGTGTIIYNGTGTTPIIATPSFGSITIGSGITVCTGTGSGSIALCGPFDTGGFNLGTISAQTNGKFLAVSGTSWTNTGTLQAINGGLARVDYTPANYSSGVLTGGHWYAYGGSTIDFGTITVATNAADVRLDGLGSHFDAINSLATNNGTFTVANGRTFNITPTTFVNNGTLNAAAGGTITITGGTDNGTINCAAGGTIIFNGSFNHGSTSFLNGSGSVIFNSGTQTFNGTIIGNIDLSLNGVANFGALSHVTTSRPFVTSGSSVLAAGAQVGFGGLAFVGGSSPAIAIGAGANSATLTLSGDVSVASVTGTSQILTSGSGANDGVLNLGGARMFTVNNNNATPDLLVSAMLVNGIITKTGPGTMALTHSNNISGTTLSNGTLQISDPGALGGAAGFILFNGGTLDLRSDQTTTTYSNPFVAITGVSQNFNIAPISNANGGTFRFTGDAIGGNLNVTGNGTLQFLAAGLSSMAGGTVIENTPTVEFNCPITGTGSITRGGSGGSTGTVIFSGSAANSYSGSTVVTRGTLMLNKSAGVTSIPHDLQILGGTVQSLASDQIADGTNVSISNGSLELDGAHESVGTISLIPNGILAGATELAVTTINNQGGAVNLTGNAIIENNAGAATFTNAGTLNKLDPANLTIREITGGTLTFANSGMVNVNGGSITLNSSALTNSGTIRAQSGLVTLSKSLTNTGTLATANGGMIRFSTPFANAGTINISGGGMISDYSSGSPLTTIAGQIKTGFASGAWNGPGINSSAAASAIGHPTAIAVAEASAIGIVGSGMFLGQSVDDTTVLVRYTYSGDANLDGTVNSSDFARLASNFGAAGKSWSDGDYNYDGTVNALDFNALATNYGQVIGSSADLPEDEPSAAIPVSLGTVVPEPVGATFLTGSCWLFGRRRRYC